ncbi:hypothetical protein AR438_11070 [Chryseobacterium aquaticum]|uniref:Uncharacterized protein n=1 Tax=Chryseobacterium aquaticum TaxID=452084 RepID=A0A0Q3SLJ1_9FLAO|nr:hypothetical protein [Chryseobacterium aquaticum]KQK26114.1 hypothetical protein AR438_11070 [Chryseobacterium aquaticum]
MWENDLQFIKDIILIIGSITSTFFAFRSYSKWKKEHKGKIKYELCRNILKTVFTLRDDFKSVRSPLSFAHELMPGYKPGESKESENLSYIFNNRFKVLYDSCNSLSSLLPEIEFEFSIDLKKKCEDILYEVKLYQMTVSEFVQISNVENIYKDEHYKVMKLKVYNIGDNNELTLKFEKLIDIIKIDVQKEINKY